MENKFHKHDKESCTNLFNDNTSLDRGSFLEVTMITEQDKLYEDFAFYAKRLKTNLLDRNEPLVIEFTGTPRSGKTICISALKKFFERNGIDVDVIKEQAEECPIPSKDDNYFFNIVTFGNTLNKFLWSISEKNHAKVILIDRGFFDALVWFNFHVGRKKLEKEIFKKIEQYVLNNDWVKYIDIVAVLKAYPEIAIKREYKDSITDIPGPIMNVDTLTEYNLVLDNCMNDFYKNKFNFVYLNTTNIVPKVGVATIAKAICEKADKLKDTPVAYIDRSLLEEIFKTSFIINKDEDITNSIEKILNNIKWKERNIIEEDDQKIQIIPAALFKYKNEVLFLEIRGAGQGERLINKVSVWAGGHIRVLDLEGESKATIQLFRKTVEREIYEELRYEINPRFLIKKPIAIVRDPTSKKSKRHLGIVFEYKVPEKDISFFHRSEKNEIGEKSLFSEFLNPTKLTKHQIKQLEFWSVQILEVVMNFEISRRIQGKFEFS